MYQHCVVHKKHSKFPKIRVKDKVQFMGDLKEVNNAQCYEEGVRLFHAVELKWAKQYPRGLATCRSNLPVLLTFYKYPKDISVPNIDAVEKIVYLVVTDYNDQWSQRIIRGFSMEKTKKVFASMYSKRCRAKAPRLRLGYTTQTIYNEFLHSGYTNRLTLPTFCLLLLIFYCISNYSKLSVIQ
ncbi:transposase [Paenibacillus oenotherae]|uniref:Transposase n=1 Tax=Paenibacillus oenotherae TaxID=1435645 RepID=A0ABS7D3B2_9BACL|nr:transposase [Paenibacillus oenotherae]